MQSFTPSTNPAAREINFEVALHWMSGQTATLSAPGFTDRALRVSAPLDFGGEGQHWSPEQLFLGALTSCCMTTYLFFAAKYGMEVTHFSCSATGKVMLVGGVYRFTQVHLYPVVQIRDRSWIETAKQCLAKTKKHCLISNSINTPLVFKEQILSNEFPGM